MPGRQGHARERTSFPTILHQHPSHLHTTLQGKALCFLPPAAPACNTPQPAQLSFSLSLSFLPGRLSCAFLPWHGWHGGFHGSDSRRQDLPHHGLGSSGTQQDSSPVAQQRIPGCCACICSLTRQYSNSHRHCIPAPLCA